MGALRMAGYHHARMAPMLGRMDTSRIDWDDLRLFLAVARTGTLTAAAPFLGLSQPTASRRLRQLEDNCGCALFQRVPGGLRLTDEGELMRARVERMDIEAVGLERELFGGDGELRGPLRLSASEWFARMVLAPRLAGFASLHPGVTVEVVADSRIVDLDRREADMVFRFPRFESPDVIQKRFVRVCYDLFASQGYLDRFGRPVDGSTGMGHRLVTMDSQLAGLPDAVWLQERFPAASVVVRSNSRDVQAASCAEGAGLAVLPRSLGQSHGLVRLTTDGQAPVREIWQGYHKDLKRLSRLRALIDHLAGTMPETV